MANFLFNRFGNSQSQDNNINTINAGSNNSINNNILSWITQLNNSPGGILDILLNKSKINQQQYNELLPYKNNPQFIAQYLMNNGFVEQLQRIEQGIKRQ